jgi:hypothetical protein
MRRNRCDACSNTPPNAHANRNTVGNANEEVSNSSAFADPCAHGQTDVSALDTVTHDHVTDKCSNRALPLEQLLGLPQ